MIPVVKSPAPANWLRRAKRATEKLCDAYNRGIPLFLFKATLYADPEIKKSLREIQHGKCAFCESSFTHIAYGDVEHFRPKAGSKQREADKLKCPGYYWLAYDWNNLFFSCQLCNQRFKRNLFPLKNSRRRARSHKHPLAREEPLLIDPTAQDPTQFIGFREEYAFAVDGCLEGGKTIDVLGLNREELVEARRDRLAMLKALVQALDLLRIQLAKNPEPALSSQFRVIEAMLQAKQEVASEYAAMNRAFLEQHPGN